MDMEDLRRAVRDARLRAGLSQTELAARAGVSRSTIDGLENGRTLELGLNKTLRILAVLDLTLAVAARHGRPTLEQLVADGDD